MGCQYPVCWWYHHDSWRWCRSNASSQNCANTSRFFSSLSLYSLVTVTYMSIMHSDPCACQIIRMASKIYWNWTELCNCMKHGTYMDVNISFLLELDGNYILDTMMLYSLISAPVISFFNARSWNFFYSAPFSALWMLEPSQLQRVYSFLKCLFCHWIWLMNFKWASLFCLPSFSSLVFCTRRPNICLVFFYACFVLFDLLHYL